MNSEKKIMETAPPLGFHVEFMRASDSEDDPVPGLQIFAFDRAGSMLESSDFRKSEGSFLGHSVSWKLAGRQSYLAEFDTNKIPTSCNLLLVLVRVSSSLSVSDLASAMSYTLAVTGDSSVQVGGLDLAFQSSQADWFITGAIMFDRNSVHRILFKDISSFPGTRGNVLGQVRDLAQDIGREVPPPGINLPNWYVLWDQSRPISPSSDTVADRTAILTSHKIPYLDDPVVRGDSTTSPRNMICSPHHRISTTSESPRALTFAPPSPYRPTSPTYCLKCQSLKTRVTELESILSQLDSCSTGPDQLVEENNSLKDRISELEVQLRAADILIEKLKQVRASTDQFGFDFSSQGSLDIPDYSHMEVSHQFAANLKLQEELLISVKEQVMRINNQVNLGRRLRGIPLPGDINQIHMSQN